MNVLAYHNFFSLISSYNPTIECCEISLELKINVFLETLKKFKDPNNLLRKFYAAIDFIQSFSEINRLTLFFIKIFLHVHDSIGILYNYNYIKMRY